ncbi:hypothetical protein [uncultured Flavobacterium sp.]|uniref:hypothetical protein n=1 Tax=uncultured Flavobacterium sp. TaxID=165435 RepID=UPI0030EF6F8A
MKNLFLLMFVALLTSCKTTYPKLSLDAVSENEKRRVYDFGKRNAETCITREFVQLSTKEVTQYVSGLSLEEMQNFCDILDKRNGKFIDMKLIEIIDNTFTNNYLVYRYKANYERNEFLNEIRIFVQTNGKFAGIGYREWKDEYIP